MFLISFFFLQNFDFFIFSRRDLILPNFLEKLYLISKKWKQNTKCVRHSIFSRRRKIFLYFNTKYYSQESERKKIGFTRKSSQNNFDHDGNTKLTARTIVFFLKTFSSFWGGLANFPLFYTLFWKIIIRALQWSKKTFLSENL
jgi:hypothetical protein